MCDNVEFVLVIFPIMLHAGIAQSNPHMLGPQHSCDTNMSYSLNSLRGFI